MKNRSLTWMMVLLVAACSHDSPPAGGSATGTAHAPPVAAVARAGAAVPAAAASRVAALPDRGELLAYPGNVVRQQGAYTWHRTAISEAHVLHSLASGHLRLTTPAGESLDFRYERHVEHASGDWTWIGELAGHKGAQAILTFGAHAVYGMIAQAGGSPLRLTMRDGATWLVETDASQLEGIEAAMHASPDFRVVPAASLSSRAPSPGPAQAVGPAVAGADPVPAPVTDVLVGYTTGFRAANGGESAALTRINYMVDLTNSAYVNGGVNGRIRLVHAMEVDYTDANSNQKALEEMSGYIAGTGTATPSPAFAALRQARETYGADLVALVRDFNEPENESCGIAWLLGGNLQGIVPGEGWDTLGYSVVSDGVDQNEEDGKSYFCRDQTFAHELGHNMGAAHDIETAKGDDGTLDNPDDYGAFLYSFGYKTDGANGNFFTIMAYGDSGQTGYLTFSTPDITFCGGHACGQENTDNVQTLNNTMPVVSGFRAAVVVDVARTRDDFNGDGVADVLWRHSGSGSNAIWLSAEKSSQQSIAGLDPAWEVATVGDFDADGITDVFWRNPATGGDMIWKSGQSDRLLESGSVAGDTWRVVGAGDFNGDLAADVLWRNRKTGANSIWLEGNKALTQAVVRITDLGWDVAGVGDFDGDGKDDILWRHAASGRNAIWDHGQYALRRNLVRIADVRWQVAGVGDFDGNGTDDILWRHAGSGANAIWPGGEYADRYNLVRISDARWVVEATGDYDGDGTSDILWRHQGSGADAIWPSASYALRRNIAAVSDLKWQVRP